MLSGPGHPWDSSSRGRQRRAAGQYAVIPLCMPRGAVALRMQLSSCHPCSAAPDNGKPQISHSTVEKQRRDRINSLIDEVG